MFKVKVNYLILLILKTFHVKALIKDFLENCGKNITLALGQSVQIKSPGHPSNYPENKECVWAITTIEGSHLTLEFNDFDVNFASLHTVCEFHFHVADTVIEVSNTATSILAA